MPLSVPFDVGWHGISLNCFGHYLWVHPGSHHANLASTGRGGQPLVWSPSGAQRTSW